MSYARQTAEGISMLSGGTITFDYTFERDGETLTEEKQVSYETVVSILTDAERAAIGIYLVIDDEIPAGKMSTGETLELDGDVIRRRFTLIDRPPPPPPSEVSDLQFRLALNAAGLRDDAEAYIAGASQDVKDWWDRATRIVRTDPILRAAMVALGKTEEDLDQVMTLAATY